ncbi:apolipoprotein N-acyltransferase [Motiliproteus sediminis]|uniref:apolipoprotein N-acyltransferase n=1 Tax=Motiliproteus sediminis TaxID=1468178 RepID=UPI001AEF4CA6|nr:apolipoprotein N-acyltransferase [Motiliproteus sediminis]
MLPLAKLPGTGTLRNLLTLLAGTLAPLGFAPVDAWPLTLLSMTLFLGLIGSADRPALSGWLFGVGFYATGVSWVFVSIHQFGPAPIPLAALLTALFVAGIALFFALPAWLLRRLRLTHPLSIAFGFPALWVLGEWFRSTFLTGFPWLLSGYAALDTPLASWAPVAGVYGVSFILASVSAGLWLLISATSASVRWSAAISVALLLGSGAAWSPVNWVTPQPSPLRISIVQGNIAQQLKWLPQQREQILQRYIEPSRQLDDTDLILWPETALPLLLDQALPRLEPLLRLLDDRQIGLITGAATRLAKPDGWRYHNSVAGLAGASGLYHKQRLVPFGEYVPLEGWLRGLIRFFDLPMSSFSLGPSHQPPLRSGDYALAPFICYEIVYPELVREAALQSDFLLTISNDAWFGDSLAPHQHLQMARMRALENGRQLIRGTNNGISALIDETGQVIAQSTQFKTEILRGEVSAMSGTTPFTRLGSTPLLLLCTLILGVIGWRRRYQLITPSAGRARARSNARHTDGKVR